MIELFLSGETKCGEWILTSFTIISIGQFPVRESFMPPLSVIIREYLNFPEYPINRFDVWIFPFNLSILNSSSKN